MNSLWGGVGATISLLLLYMVTMTALGGWDVAIEQFQSLWYLMIPIAAGFGIQVFLYLRLQHAIRQKTTGAVAAGGAAGSVGMLACCAHHAADVLPVLGLSAAATLIARYQVPLLITSLLINLTGIVIMKRHLTKII